MAKYRIFAIIALAAFLFGASSGGWLVYKWAASQEAGRLKIAIEREQQAAIVAQQSLHSYYTDQLDIERSRIKTREVIKYVPTDPICNVSDDERRMLNDARAGMPETAAGADEKAPEAATAGELSRSVEVAAHVDCGLRYREISSQLTNLIDYLENTRK